MTTPGSDRTEADLARPRAPAATRHAPQTAARLATLALEETEDSRRVRRALAVAVLVHMVVFAVQLPESVEAVRVEDEKPLFVMTPVRFKPPPPQTTELPPPPARKQPIPDPTPDEPEPLRLAEDVVPIFELPTSDLLVALPEAPPPLEPEGPIPVGGDVRAPVKIHAPPPRYTEVARKARIQGVVILESIIDREGRVTDLRVLRSLPLGLDQAAVEAVRTWTFEPATLNGKPVAVIYNLTINFRLQ